MDMHYLTFLFVLVFTLFLVILTCIDIRDMLLPDKFTLALLWLGLAINSFHVFTSLENAVWGAIVGYLVLYGLNAIYRAIRKQDGLGGGDFKLLAALGAWCGWQNLPLLVLIASMLGLCFILIAGLRGKWSLKKPLPFGPFLAIAGWISLVLLAAN